jgi:hypothetical protein
MEEELPPVLDDSELFASAHETRAATIAELALDEGIGPLPDDDFDDEEEKVRYKKVFIGAPMWVVTFGDLMSLLLTFFVLILSFSTMDPVKFKIVRGSLDTALGIQKKISAKSMPKADNMMATEFSRRDFNKQIESILKKALRDTFPPGQEPGRVEKVNDIRGEVVRFIAYDLFLPGSEADAPKAKTVYQVMADTLVNMNARMEVRGIALERFARDLRLRGRARKDGVSAVRVAARRAVIASRHVQKRRPKEISSRTVLPGVTPGLATPEPPGVVNLTEFVFLAPDKPAKKSSNP